MREGPGMGGETGGTKVKVYKSKSVALDEQLLSKEKIKVMNEISRILLGSRGTGNHFIPFFYKNLPQLRDSEEIAKQIFAIKRADSKNKNTVRTEITVLYKLVQEQLKKYDTAYLQSLVDTDPWEY